MELERDDVNEIKKTVSCPECEHDIPVNPDWQEEDEFVCPNCSCDLQVVSLDPVMIDFAPEDESSWDEPEELEALGLDDDDEVELASEDDEEDEEDWDEPVSRRVATLRSARVRRPVRKEGEAAVGEVIYLTPEGAARLREELERLRTERLPKVTAWLSDAMADGFEDEDVTELEEARSELSFIEGRIRSLESLLSSADVLAEPESKDVVQLGSRVTVVEGDAEPETYRIVSPAEADPLSGYISHVSPLGRALIGRQVGEQVVVASPDGPIEFRIVDLG
jgi:transcription elongation factor GreA